MNLASAKLAAHQPGSAAARDVWCGQRGQAMPLAAVGLFAMALAVIATLNLGQAVHERIKLQNTADSAAYTLAAMEARTFNYIAFLNRTQVAHYNTAMVVQSYLSWVSFRVELYGLFVDVYTGFANAFYDLNEWCSDICPAIPYVGSLIANIVKLANEGIQAAKKVFWAGRDATMTAFKTAEKEAHEFVEAVAIFNATAMFERQFWRAILLNGHLYDGMQHFVKMLDPQMKLKDSGAARWALHGFATLANQYEYHKVFDDSAGLNPGLTLLAPKAFAETIKASFKLLGKKRGYLDPEEDKQHDAIKVMTEICNASRSPNWVAKRSEDTAKVGVAVPSFDVSRTINLGIGKVKVGMGMDLGMAASGKDKVGGTRFVTEAPEEPGPRVDAIRSDKNYEIGKYLASDDFFAGASRGIGGGGFWAGAPPLGINAFFGVRWSRDASLGSAIAAYSAPEDSWHFGYSAHEKDEEDDNSEHTFIRPAKSDEKQVGPTLIVMMKNDSGTEKSHTGEEKYLADQDDGSEPESAQTKWRWPGFAAYFKFKPDSDRTKNYNQPNTLIFLTKTAEDFQAAEGGTGTPKVPWHFKFKWDENGRKSGLDTTIAGERSKFLFEGFKVVARGQVYYHRPGNWREHPNFFNPFWRARLAPVAPYLINLWERFVGSNITTNSNNALVQGVVNLVRNAQMDLFVAAITSILTH